MRKVFYLIGTVVCAVFFLCLLLVPCDLKISVTAFRLYDGHDVTADDLSVRMRTPFGISYPASKVTVKNPKDDEVTVHAGYLSKTIGVNKIPAAYLQVEYIGQHYQYDTVTFSDDDFQILLVYEDEAMQTIPFTACEHEGLPSKLTDDVNVRITYAGLSATVTVRPIKLTKFVPVVDGGLQSGMTFDLSKVSVTALFADGSSKEVTDLTSSYEGTVYPGSDVVVTSKVYGDISIPVDDSNIHGYNVGYTGKIYEGDVVTADMLSLSVTYTDGTQVPIEDAVCDDVRIFEQQKVSVTSAQFGTLNCTVTPIPVQKILCEATLDGNGILHVSGLKFVYTDQTERQLDMKDVTFVTDLSQPLKNGANEIHFTWFDHEYSFTETVVG